MKILLKCSVTILLLLLFLGRNTILAWNDEVTHKDLTVQAAIMSNLDQSNIDYLMQSLGFSLGLYEKLLWENKVCDEKANQSKCSVRDWLKYGAQKEDESIEILAMTRTVNHFHDPYRNWGLNDLGTGLSALVWAQDGDSQSKALEGDQSWHTLRNCYWTALTAQSEEARQEWFARMFKGLGHQMHLVQDMAVPYHVRNDAHLSDAFLHVSPRGIRYFESWAKGNPAIGTWGRP